MRKNKRHTWEFEGNTFTVGESLENRVFPENSIYPIVWYKNKLYKVIRYTDRIKLQDLYLESQVFWTRPEYVFYIIKVN